MNLMKHTYEIIFMIKIVYFILHIFHIDIYLMEENISSANNNNVTLGKHVTYEGLRHAD